MHFIPPIEAAKIDNFNIQLWLILAPPPAPPITAADEVVLRRRPFPTVPTRPQMNASVRKPIFTYWYSNASVAAPKLAMLAIKMTDFNGVALWSVAS
ncbi:hypothetical protein Leryth_007202 [Lithospermum erythrorhizon]|nr:hypothetical protein Leryth_007202 [Lithospermum erythrorhizon]